MNKDQIISLFFNNKSFVQIDDNKIWAFLVIRLYVSQSKSMDYAIQNWSEKKIEYIHVNSTFSIVYELVN